MLVRVGYDIQFHLPAQTAMIAVLNVHPSHDANLLEPDELKTQPALNVNTFIDCFGNRRLVRARHDNQVCGPHAFRMGVQ